MRPRRSPGFACCYPADRVRGLCGLEARWKAHPIASSSSWWFYCDAHRPDAAEPLEPTDLRRVAHVLAELSVVTVTGDQAAAVDEAIWRLRAAVESIGGTLSVAHTRLEVHAPEGASASVGRLELVERPEPFARTRSALLDENVWYRGAPWRRRRKAS